MMASGFRRNVWSTPAGLSLILFVLILLVSSAPFVGELQSRINDTYIRLAPRPSSPSPVTLVLIDDDSLRQYGRWPWSRTLLAQLVHNAGIAGASIIAVDILLTEPQSPETDLPLRHAFDK